MMTRLLIIRRAMRLSRERGEEIGLGAPRGDTRSSRHIGVPPEIAATFPSFKYEAATFKSTRANARAGASAVVVATPVLEEHVVLDVGTPQAQENAGPLMQPFLSSTAGVNDGALTSNKTSTEAAVESRPHGPETPHSASASLVAAEGHGRGDGAAKSDSEDGCDDPDAPQCSVCIADFEEGEMLRQLPCMHVFHQSCIDPWMTSHSTCPNCRQALWTGATASVSSNPRRQR